MSGEPILGKVQDAPVRAGRTITWAMFRRLRAWAKVTSEATGYPVYLVGSALTKSRPRDIDVAIIMPVAEFEATYGPIPESGTDAMQEYLHQIAGEIGLYDLDAQMAIKGRKRVDVKLTPDTWWPEKDRLLLAYPYSQSGYLANGGDE